VATEAAFLLARIGADLSELERGMREAGMIVEKGGKDLRRPAQRAGQGIGQSMAQSMMMAMRGGFSGLASMLMGSVPAVGAMFGLFKASEQVLALSKLGAAAERTRDSFEMLFSLDAERMLGPLREASRGAAADSDLLLAANKASMLGVSSSVEELTKLMEVARVRGQAMGLSTTQAFSDLVTGIGRTSPMILDNLGIITGGEKTYEEFAVSIGKSADALTEAEKKQALLNKVLIETQPLLDAQADAAMTSAEKIDALSAAWLNYKEAVGVSLAEAPEGARSLADTLNVLTGRMKTSSELLELFNSLARELDALSASGDITAEQFRLLSGALGATMSAASLGHMSAEEMERALMGISNAIEELSPLTELQERRLRGLDNEMDSGIRSAQAYAAALHEVQSEIAAQSRTRTARAFHWGDGVGVGAPDSAVRDQQKAA